MPNFIKSLFILTLCCCVIPFVQAQNDSQQWADSTLHHMSMDQRIGQLFMMAAYSNKNEAAYKKYVEDIKNYQVGGIIFMQGSVDQQIQLTNRFQAAAHIPLFIAIDGEWGLSMRLKNTIRYPRQMTLGAIRNEYLIYQMGLEVGREMQRIGIHINFAPDVDVNTNPTNPVINTRSFGEDEHDVARKGSLYMKGMQEAGLIAVAKHFPGHGNTSVDSHLGLPKVTHTPAQLAQDLYPFRKLIDAGVQGVITGHLWVPDLDSLQRASSLSPKIVQGLLRDSMHFQGLIFTDGMGMAGVKINSDSIYKDAILAGNDIILFPPNLEKAIAEVKAAVQGGSISDSIINERCRRILISKYKHGLSVSQRVSPAGVDEVINSTAAQSLVEQLTQQSITILKNKRAFLPLVDSLVQQKQSIISLGHAKQPVFENTCRFYRDASVLNYSLNPSAKDIKAALNKVKSDSLVIVALYSNSLTGSSAVTDGALRLLDTLSRKKKVVLCMFTNPYVLSRLASVVPQLHALVLGYETSDIAQRSVAQVIYGGTAASGLLPVSIPNLYPRGTGEQTAPIRMGINLPESEGMSSSDLNEIDAIVQDGIDAQAMPGCQVLVARKGKVVFNKSYGYYTYDKKHAVQDSDLYDVASVTKVVATLPAVMKLVEEHQLNLTDTLGAFFDEFKHSEKGSVSIEQLLRHESGFPSFIPMVNHFIDLSKLNGKPLYSPRKTANYPFELDRHYYGNKDRTLMTDFFSTTPGNGYSMLIAKGMYAKPIVKDSIWQAIIDVPLGRKHYVYSDLNFMILQKVVEKISGEALDTYCNDNFWLSLNGGRTTYSPIRQFAQQRMAPTENDHFYRRQIVQGTVHDLNAALMGGVSGHAGVFSSASDLSKMMQMYLNGGTYGGKRYLSTQVIQQFSETTEGTSRRGLGFDKPEQNIHKRSPVAQECSALSFGHTGFTGAITWVDPKYDLIYVFLSNRVYPNAYNEKLVSMGIRTEIQRVIYKSIDSGFDQGVINNRYLYIPKMSGMVQVNWDSASSNAVALTNSKEAPLSLKQAVKTQKKPKRRFLFF